MIRLILGLCGVLVGIIGHDMHSPAAVVVGLTAAVPLLLRVLALPAASRAGFLLSAVVAGMLLAGYAAGHPGSPDQSRPVPAACVMGVAR